MSEIGMGTLYDLNKMAVEQGEVALVGDMLEEKKELIMEFLKDTNAIYYMLLSNERKDYTVFRWVNISNDDDAKEIAQILVDECLTNRGEIRGIDLTKTKDAIEIWMVIDDEAYVYYFFPYDNAIIEVGGF